MAKEEERKIAQDDFLSEAKSFFEANRKEVGKVTKSEGKVVVIDFKEFSSFSPELGEYLIERPEETIQLLEVALEEMEWTPKKARVRFSSISTSQEILIRNIRAKHLGKMISIEGLIRKASEVRPQVVNAKFECPSCGTIISVLQIDKKFKEPSRCSCGRRGGFKEISKDMVDAQALTIEESPENLTGGEQPKRMVIFLKEDLVDPKMEMRTTPGSRVRIIGVLKEIALSSSSGAVLTRFDLAIEANNVIPLEESFEDIDISEEDERAIREIAADPELLKKMTKSIAPSIWGYEDVKKALALQLFGGVPKKRSDETKMRGDIHVLLVGDPGVAKSVMLSFIAGVAPKARYVSGKSSTGAGLTATVVKDDLLRGWSLEAGAMVLANKGILCIDEFDKMDEEDRSTMHEAMEQQCYLPDLEIMFADSSKKKISEFVDKLMEKEKERIIQGNECEILPLKKEYKLLTTDFEKIYPVRIKNVSRHIAPNNFVRISLKNGNEISVTPNHPCWVLEDGEIKTIPAKDLKKGDFFPVPGELPIKENGSDELLCKIIGYHITDGCYELNRGKKTGIQFWNNNLELIHDYKKSVEKYFKLKAGITKRRNQFAVRVISKKVVEFLNNLDKDLMEKGRIKKIPEKIMSYDKESVSVLLRAIFDGDGSVINVKRNSCRINFVSENKKLAEQVSELLLRFGVTSSIYTDKNVFRLDICGEENLSKFYYSINFKSKNKSERLKEYLRKNKSVRSVTDVVPNVSKTINEIFDILKINKEKELPSQICLNCNKNRINLNKLIGIAEERLGKLKKELKELKESKVSLKKIRESLDFSAMSIYKKLGVNSYQFSKIEKEKCNMEHKIILKTEIESALKAEEKIKNLKKLSSGKIRWSKIKSVEIYENNDTHFVYDVTIEPTHSFISNRMVLHNSVTISKATVQATLRAQTSVLAAANPKFGRFDPTQSIPKQVALAPSLISRFDAIFIMRDIPRRDRDESIAMHVLTEHKQEIKHDVIEKELLRKYISYSKQKFNPVLTDEAINEIKKFYVGLRNQPQFDTGVSRPIPIGARQLEALVRLAEAHARMRLSKEVKKADAQSAIELMKNYLMQVGYDEETKTIDIDRISGNSASQRTKISVVRETIEALENRLGKLIPFEEVEKALKDKMKPEDIDEAVGKLLKSGDLFRPRRGYIQRM